MSLKQKAMKGMLWSVLQNWGTRLISFVIFSLLARILQPEVFGIVAMAGVYIAFIEVFMNQGFGTAIEQRNELAAEHLDTAFWTYLGIGLLIILLSITTAKPAANLLKQPDLVVVIQLLSFSFLFKAFSGVQISILRRDLNIKILAVRSIIATLIGGMAGIVMALLGFGVWALVSKTLVEECVGALVLWHSSSWRPGFRFSIRHFRELFAFGVNMVGSQFVAFLNGYMDNFLVGYFLGPVMLGYYAVAYRLLGIVTNLLTGVSTQVALPAFSKLQNEPERMRNAFYTTTQLTSLLSFPVFMGMATLTPELVRGLFGEQWMPSIPVMRVLSLAGIVYSVNFFNGVVLIAMGKPGWRFAFLSIRTVINVIAFFLVVRWGIVAVATVHAISSYLLSPLELWIIRRIIHIDISRYLRQYSSSIIGSLSMVFCILISRSYVDYYVSTRMSIFICIPIAVFVYFLAILIIRREFLLNLMNLARLSLIREEKLLNNP
jgi:polysaccharide transporter, PST family